MGVISKKILSPDEALDRAASYCVKAERCIRQVREKLYQWGIRGEDIDAIIETLLERQFIDESRYARAYARDKHRFSAWGARRISSELSQRGISSQVIREAIMELQDEYDIDESLKTLLERKYRTISKDMPRRKVWEQMVRYAMYRGYDYDALRSVLVRLLDGDEDDE